MDTQWLLKKSMAVVRKGPATLRNVVFSKLGIWPVGRIADPELRALPTYCISLKRETKRRAIMLAQARSMGLEHFEFFDAFDAQGMVAADLSARGLYDDARSLATHGRSLAIPEIAGTLSHGRVFELMIERNQPRALILEDDALFLTARINKLAMSAIPADAEIVFLSTFLHPSKPLVSVAGNLYTADAYGGSAAAYIITLSGAKKMATQYKPVAFAADGAFNLAQGSQTDGNSLKGYIVYPDPVLNGSVCYYYNSSLIPSIRRQLQKGHDASKPG